MSTDRGVGGAKIEDNIHERAQAFDLVKGMMDICTFVYTFNTIRDIVRKHDARIADTKYNSMGEPSIVNPDPPKGWFSWLSKGPKQVMFKSPELIITDSGSQQKHPDRNFAYPVDAGAIVQFFEQDDDHNRRWFQQDASGNITFDETASLDNCDFEFLGEMKENIAAGHNIKILDYDDAFSDSKGGLTCGMIVNLTKKWVCVVFRGTVGLSDWKANVNFDLNHKDMFPDHAKFEGKDEDRPGTHAGFTEYIVTPRPADINRRPYLERLVSSLEFAFDPDAKLSDNDTNPKPIITDDFNLYVTGHSLGGGLANLFAYHLADLKKRNDASAKHIPKKIHAITFAAPVIGNYGHNLLYQELEKEGFLRHIRVSNNGDLVPGKVPSTFSFLPVPYVNTRKADYFTSNGLNVHLHEDGQADVSYRGTVSSFSQFYSYNPMAALRAHGVGEYERRIKLAIKKYEGCFNKTLEVLYTEEAGDFTS
eukprot:CAMPEP_0172397476 /NCGR_PEP_ID=MMETSP1061-20121228/30797_1 /TAXON_ID=37318 /ORGANISM="Pseudo-nitzschia pungens, Strain cf. pungens" /LENGTH=477 /DNA_ID=CAMNT_0013129669 /DNA_START=109 /DNA_END=1542 /DNA_ORIENTATION=+